MNIRKHRRGFMGRLWMRLLERMSLKSMCPFTQVSDHEVTHLTWVHRIRWNFHIGAFDEARDLFCSCKHGRCFDIIFHDEAKESVFLGFHEGTRTPNEERFAGFSCELVNRLIIVWNGNLKH